MTRADLKIAAALFLTGAGVFGLAAPGHLYLLDAHFKVTWAENALTRGQLHFDRDQIGDANRIGTYFNPGRNGDLYIHFPLGGLFCNIPPALAAHGLGRLIPAVPEADFAYVLATLNNIPYAAAAMVVLFALGCRLGLSRRPAVAAALAFGFATPLFPYATYDFNEPVAAFFVLLACYLVIAGWGGKRVWSALGAGAAVGFAATIRYEVVLFAAGALTLWFVLAFLRRSRWAPAVAFAGAFALVAAVVPLYNWYARGSAGDFAYNTVPFFANLLRARFKPLTGGGPLLFAARFAWVYFLSPNMHNVLIYCPFVLFGVAGVRALVRRRGVGVLFLVVPGAFLGAAVVAISYSSWAWGLRYAFLFWIIVGAAGVLVPRRRKWVRVAYVVCVVWGAALSVVAVLADYQMTQNDIAAEILGDASQVNYRGWLPEGRIHPRYSQILWQFEYAGLAAARTADYYVHRGRFEWTRPSRYSRTDVEGNMLDIWPVYAQVQGGASWAQVWPPYLLLLILTVASARWLRRLVRANP